MRGRTVFAGACAIAMAAAAANACGGDDDAGGGGGALDGSTDAIAPGDGGPGDGGGSDAIVDGGPAGEVCSGDGWCWANPLPQGNALHATWAASPTDAWVGGVLGTLLHWDGAKWAVVPSGTTNDIMAMWGSSPTDVYAGGDKSTLLHWDGVAWTAVTTTGVASTNAIEAIWGSAANDIWISDGTSSLRHWDGMAWTLKGPSFSVSARGIAGTSSTDVWAVGSDYNGILVIAHWDGMKWTRSYASDAGGAGSNLQAVWARGPNDAWAVGANGLILHYDGAWTPSPSGSTTAYFRAVWGSGTSDVWALDGYGPLRHWTGSAWEIAVTPVAPLDAIGGSGTAVWAVGEGGSILRGSGATWTPAVTGTRADYFYRVWARAADDVWAVGKNGLIWHYDGKAWTETPSGSTTFLAGVWGASADDVWAAGEPEVLRWNGTKWSPFDAGIGGSGLPGLRGIYGFAANDIWSMQSQIRHWDGVSWSDKPGAVSGGGNAMWGSNTNDVWFVGEDGDIEHWDGGAVGRYQITSGNGISVRMFSVGGTGANDVWAGSTQGMFHFDGGAWGPSPSPAVASVWAAAPNDAWAVDYQGTIAHWDGSKWTAQQSGTKNALIGVWGTPTDIWAVGEYGTILRHRR